MAGNLSFKIQNRISASSTLDARYKLFNHNMLINIYLLNNYKYLTYRKYSNFLCATNAKQSH